MRGGNANGRVAGRPRVSTLELIIALVTLGLVAALTVPRLMRGATQDPGPALRTSLKTLRVAIARYYQDHNHYPGALGDGQNEAGSEAAFVAQLTKFSDAQGRVSDRRDDTYCFGPYLRDGIPPCPVPPAMGKAGVWVLSNAGPPTFTPGATEAGWVYDCGTGQIAANSDAPDGSGRSYASY